MSVFLSPRYPKFCRRLQPFLQDTVSLLRPTAPDLACLIEVQFCYLRTPRFCTALAHWNSASRHCCFLRGSNARFQKPFDRQQLLSIPVWCSDTGDLIGISSVRPVVTPRPSAYHDVTACVLSTRLSHSARLMVIGEQTGLSFHCSSCTSIATFDNGR